jgi:class 3 adenylate cyclase
MKRAKSESPAPSFWILRVMIPGFLMFLVLSLFFGFFFVASSWIRRELQGAQGIVLDFSDRSEPHLRIVGQAAPLSLASAGREAFADIGLAAVLLGMAGAYLYHLPLTRIFRRKRAGESIPEKVAAAARARIFYSPGVTALFTPALLAAMVVLRLSVNPTEAPTRWMLSVEAPILALSALFTYLWQRHRVQAVYLPHLFTREELASRFPGGHRSRVRGDIFRLVFLSTILPVVVVALFIGTGISVAGKVSSLSPDQRELLFGTASPGSRIRIEGLSPKESNLLKIGELSVPFVAPLDVARIVAGLGLGLAFILVYVYLIAHWTASDIVEPLELLRSNMGRAREGDLDALTPAVTANELGDLTVGFNDMLRGIAERERIKALFGQYLTKEISEAILDGRVNLDGARYEATVMFTDIRGFTAMSERMSPEEVFAFLNGYLGRMIEVIAARGGIIDKFLGDGILAVFGIPVPSSHHAADAFAAALDMRSQLAEMNTERAALGLSPVEIGIGMHTGAVIAGNVGSARKLQFTVIGDAVNLASRIEDLNKRYGSYLLISGATHALLGEAGEESRFEHIRGAVIRGKSEKVDLYRLSD